MSGRHEHAGPMEAARHLGISRQRLYQLRHTYKDFPAPAAELATGPIWHLADIERWESKHPNRTTVPLDRRK